jgi:hypothetical protein
VLCEDDEAAHLLGKVPHQASVVDIFLDGRLVASVKEYRRHLVRRGIESSGSSLGEVPIVQAVALAVGGRSWCRRVGEMVDWLLDVAPGAVDPVGARRRRTAVAQPGSAWWLLAVRQ